MDIKNGYQCLLDIEDSTMRLQSRLYEILDANHLSYTIEYAGIEFNSEVPLTDKERTIYQKKRKKLVTKLVSDYLHTQAKYVSSTSEIYKNPAEDMISQLEKSYIDPVEAQSPITPEEYAEIRKEAEDKGRSRDLNFESYQVRVQNPREYKDEDFITYEPLEPKRNPTDSL